MHLPCVESYNLPQSLVLIQEQVLGAVGDVTSGLGVRQDSGLVGGVVNGATNAVGDVVGAVGDVASPVS